ncbi:unnamed protein product, partial [Phaeothamnion confervicola]
EAAAASEAEEEEYDSTDFEHTCQFCGVHDPDFTEEALDLHYWQHCAMLMGCNECGQVVEVVALTEHLLDECPQRAQYVQCPVSGMAVRRADMAGWTASKSCRPPGPAGPGSACPLCFNDVAAAADEDSWKSHLMESCPRNPRRQAAP